MTSLPYGYQLAAWPYRDFIREETGQRQRYLRAEVFREMPDALKPRRIPIDNLAASNVQQLGPKRPARRLFEGLRMAEHQGRARVSLAAGHPGAPSLDQAQPSQILSANGGVQDV
jgi:hypothetical protein